MLYLEEHLQVLMHLGVGGVKTADVARHIERGCYGGLKLLVAHAEISPLGHTANDPHGAKLADFPTGFEYHCRRGMALYRLGEPMPKRAWSEDGAPLDVTEEETYVFMGWLLERGKEFFKRRKVEDALRPDPDEPRPRRAA